MHKRHLQLQHDSDQRLVAFMCTTFVNNMQRCVVLNDTLLLVWARAGAHASIN